MPDDGPDYSNISAGGQVNVTHPLHVEQHEHGGEDEINLEGLSGSPADVGDATEATLAEIKDRIGDEVAPASGTSNKQLADILTELGTLLTELQLKADLTETQPVSLASIPTGAITVADGADVAAGAVADAVVAAGAVGTSSAKLRRVTTDLDALLTELKLKADLTETQPVSAVSLPLPSGAATSAKQDTALTALQSIQNLVGALQSVGINVLQVRGEDQLFNIKKVLWEKETGAISGAGGYIESDSVDSGEYWVITNIMAVNQTTATTLHQYRVRHDNTDFVFHDEAAAFAAFGRSYWKGTIILDPDDTIRVYFTGGLGGDTCEIVLGGYVMVIE